MGYVLFQLEHNLRSQKEQLSPQEENFFQRWKSSALNQFTAGVIAGGGLVWAESWKLNRLLRVNLSGGGAIVLGLWRFKNSLDSSVDHILGLDGTRMQRDYSFKQSLDSTCLLMAINHATWARVYVLGMGLCPD
ncbi:hypothetical protein V6N12_028941 [Hibiscus sabdariffa]|uniref:Uncharacterized protein n=1 Tax=Hibiscus sabdariffa TaxID=183260 RepID=A0ABR2F7A0_9ROSI